MIPSNHIPTRPSLRFAALTVSVLGLACFAAPALTAADPVTPPAAQPGAALPLSATFEKTSHNEEGMPYVLHLKNDSANTVKVSAKVRMSVTAHNAEKTRSLPAHAIKAGQSWKISNLSALDHVIVTADGYAPLELTVK